MRCVPVGASRRLRWGCLSLTAIVALLALTSDPADARRHHKRSHGRLASISSSYDPPYAAIVVDAKNGGVLHAANPDAPRHPASLTKIMTLYLLFERLESGKITLETQMPVSEEASIQAPTKLGLKPGETLKVEDAIKALVTKSANDAAVVIAEALGGSEDEFARAMTRKARALGMKNTTYRNANGLPNDEQITTARDQALLGIAIQERFPKYYRYFSTLSFVYRGNAMRNHNHLLGKVEGVDGIKTGFTRDSGFNLVTSVKRGPRHIVAVVLGGRSASSRDARMRDLIETHIAQASTKPPAALVAEAAKPEPTPAQAAKPQLASADSAQVSISPPRANEAPAPIAPGSNAPITPVKVKTVTVKLVPPKNRGHQHCDRQRDARPCGKAGGDARHRVRGAHSGRGAGRNPCGRSADRDHGTIGPTPPPARFRRAWQTAGRGGGRQGGRLSGGKGRARAGRQSRRIGQDRGTLRLGAPPCAPRRLGHPGRCLRRRGRSQAKNQLGQEQDHRRPAEGRGLHRAHGEGRQTYYRARFAGFDRDQAEAACKRLKREDVACMALKI